ncbi:protein C19orf12 homolog [Hoplias malabaricus]|uniref:protein C19orf12 homolog n=1 Tax=Hoplias malabaricus TaxID=27720 RepID=UPI003462AB4B
MEQKNKDIMEMLLALATEEQLVVVAKNAAKGAVIGFLCAGLGMAIGGSAGCVAGAAAGTVLAVAMSNDIKSLSDVLMELAPGTKEVLCNVMKKLLKDVFWQCVDTLIERVLGDGHLKKLIVKLLESFFEETMKMKVKTAE